MAMPPSSDVQFGMVAGVTRAKLKYAHAAYALAQNPQLVKMGQESSTGRGIIIVLYRAFARRVDVRPVAARLGVANDNGYQRPSCVSGATSCAGVAASPIRGESFKPGAAKAACVYRFSA